jgi:hypothetical protein
MLGRQLNGFLEEGNHGVTFEHVYNGLDNGTLWEIVNKKVPDMDLSMFTGYPEQGDAVISALKDAAGGMRGREVKKYGVKAGGLSLLMAYVIEAIQEEYWVPGSTSRYYVKP